MTDRQFVKQQFPEAFLEKSTIGLKEIFYVRKHRVGRIIASGSTRHIAWNNAKAEVKKILYGI